MYVVQLHAKFLGCFLQKAQTFRTHDLICRHLVSSPSFARQRRLANDGLDTRWPPIESSLIKMSLWLSAMFVLKRYEAKAEGEKPKAFHFLLKILKSQNPLLNCDLE